MIISSAQEKIKDVLVQFYHANRIYFVEFELKMNLLAQGLPWIMLDWIITDLSEDGEINVEDGTKMSASQRENRIIRLSEYFIETAHKERLQK